MSYQSDYILRIIEQFGSVLRRMLSAITEQRPAQVLDASTEALELAMGMDPATVLALDGPSLLALVKAGGDAAPATALMVGEVFALRARAMEMGGSDGAADAARARTLLEYAASVGDDDQRARARDVLVGIASG